LATSGPSLPKFVLVSIIQLLCRLVKKAWPEDSAFRDILDEIGKFLKVNYNIHSNSYHQVTAFQQLLLHRLSNIESIGCRDE
jgi:hypothetical protein